MEKPIAHLKTQFPHLSSILVNLFNVFCKALHMIERYVHCSKKLGEHVVLIKQIFTPISKIKQIIRNLMPGKKQKKNI